MMAIKRALKRLQKCWNRRSHEFDSPTSTTVTAWEAYFQAVSFLGEVKMSRWLLSHSTLPLEN